MEQGPRDRVAVVIPARNEAATVGEIVAEVRTRHPDFDIIVVDDASGDATGAIARKAGAEVLRTPVRLGYGGAVQTGLKLACKRRYDLVILMDADGQHDPSSIERLVLASQHYDLVIGSRFLGEASYSIPLVRRIGMRIFSMIASAVVGHRITDTSSGFQALRRNVFTLFALGDYPVDFPDADMVIWVAKHGYRVGEVGVKMHERRSGRSMISGFRSSLKYAMKMPLAILVTLLRMPSLGREGSQK